MRPRLARKWSAIRPRRVESGQIGLDGRLQRPQPSTSDKTCRARSTARRGLVNTGVA